MQTACTTSARLQNSTNTIIKNYKTKLFLWKWRTLQGAGCRVQVQRDFSKQPTCFMYMFLQINAFHSFGLMLLHVWRVCLTQKLSYSLLPQNANYYQTE